MAPSILSAEAAEILAEGIIVARLATPRTPDNPASIAFVHFHGDK
jgi:hypothetical protein